MAALRLAPHPEHFLTPAELAAGYEARQRQGWALDGILWPGLDRFVPARTPRRYAVRAARAGELDTAAEGWRRLGSAARPAVFAAPQTTPPMAPAPEAERRGLLAMAANKLFAGDAWIVLAVFYGRRLLRPALTLPNGAALPEVAGGTPWLLGLALGAAAVIYALPELADAALLLGARRRQSGAAVLPAPRWRQLLSQGWQIAEWAVTLALAAVLVRFWLGLT